MISYKHLQPTYDLLTTTLSGVSNFSIISIQARRSSVLHIVFKIDNQQIAAPNHSTFTLKSVVLDVSCAHVLILPDLVVEILMQ